MLGTRYFFSTLSFTVFFVILPVHAESNIEQAESAARNDYLKKGPLLASYGGVACFTGFGLSPNEKKEFDTAGAGPSRCGCTQEDRQSSEEFIGTYNRTMLELLREERKTNRMAKEARKNLPQ